MDSGQNRLVQAVPLVIGQNVYTINTGGFNSRTVGVVGVVVIMALGRKRLGERDYGEASSLWQPTTTASGWPVVFARMSPTQVYVAPKPNQAYDAEWDTAVVSADLVNPTDADPLPYPWTDPVPFLAASLARLEAQQYEESEKYKQLYLASLSDIVGGTQPTFVRSPYPAARSRA